MGAAGLMALGNLTGGRWAAAARPFYLAVDEDAAVRGAAVRSVRVRLGPDLSRGRMSSGEAWRGLLASQSSRISARRSSWRGPPRISSSGLLVAWWLGSVSRLDLPPASTPAMRRAGASRLVLLVPTATFAAFDWVMSLEPHWYSSIYGAILTAGGVVAAHALAIVALALTRGCTRANLSCRRMLTMTDRQRMLDVFGDLGNLMLAFMMVWTYFSFSQFLIIWSANLPSEIAWYLRRLAGGWQFVALRCRADVFCRAVFVLLSRDLKRNVGRLAVVATILLVGYALNMYWTIVPAFPVRRTAAGTSANVGALIGLGGLWLAFYCWHFGRMLAYGPFDASDGNDNATR